jgi:hypothetical protein
MRAVEHTIHRGLCTQFARVSLLADHVSSFNISEAHRHTSHSQSSGWSCASTVRQAHLSAMPWPMSLRTRCFSSGLASRRSRSSQRMADLPGSRASTNGRSAVAGLCGT